MSRLQTAQCRLKLHSPVWLFVRPRTWTRVSGEKVQCLSNNPRLGPVVLYLHCTRGSRLRDNYSVNLKLRWVRICCNNTRHAWCRLWVLVPGATVLHLYRTQAAIIWRKKHLSGIWTNLVGDGAVQSDQSEALYLEILHFCRWPVEVEDCQDLKMNTMEPSNQTAPLIFYKSMLSAYTAARPGLTHTWPDQINPLIKDFNT